MNIKLMLVATSSSVFKNSDGKEVVIIYARFTAPDAKGEDVHNIYLYTVINGVFDYRQGDIVMCRVKRSVSKYPGVYEIKGDLTPVAVK